MLSLAHKSVPDGLPSGIRIPKILKDKKQVISRSEEYVPGTSVPDRVQGSYPLDFNINLIHKAILIIFAYRKWSLTEKRETIANLERKIKTHTLTVNEVKICEDDINDLLDEIVDITDKKSENEYLDAAIPVLERYNEISTDDSKGIVSMRKLVDKTIEDEKIIDARLGIINEYLSIAKNYIIIDLIETRNNKATCPGCGLDSSNTFVDTDSGFTICICGHQEEVLSYTPGHQDYMRVNTTTKSNYEDRENFEKGLTKFQGKQRHIPPDKLYEQLEDYFSKSRTLPKRKDVIALPIDSLGRKAGTSLQMMIEALIATNNTCYYDDLNLIMHKFWGWELPYISPELYNQLLQDYDATQAIYYAIPDKHREASLNVQWRILVQLLARGYPARKDGFKLQTSRDSLEFHQRVWRIMCERTGVPFVPII